jgi:hypothetical protein
VAIGLIVCPPDASANSFPRYPLKNGDFSAYQGWGRPAGWALATEAGAHTFTLDPVPQQPLQDPGEAVVATTAAGQGYIYQDVDLIEGIYRLSAEASGTPGAVAFLEISGSDSGQSLPVVLDAGWQTLSLDTSTLSGATRIHLRFQSAAGEEVRYRQVRLDPLQLVSGPVDFTNGATLGGLVLAALPDPAERYAAYELQRYIRAMTGTTPGIEGRDTTTTGVVVRVGAAADAGLLQTLDGLPADSYLLNTTGSVVSLAGNTGLGTLYAAYDFLEQQGCYWVLPGDTGEVVPARPSLSPASDRIESPDYPLVRAMGASLQQVFFPGGGPEMGWIYHDIDEQLDWIVRNRLNTFWSGGPTYDLGADRGHGWLQDSGHSWNAIVAPHQVYFADHPDWYALVNGQWMPVSDVGPMLPNQLNVSNQELRDFTVDLILQYFQDNPDSHAFPMSPMDGPSYSCECVHCRALDPPGYVWNQDFSGFPVFPNLQLPPLADRHLNYVNYVAQEVAAVYPNKLLELYTYANREPPQIENVHSNILLKYVWLSGRAMNVSLMDPVDPLALQDQQWLAGWNAAGTQTLTYYPYTDWEHPDGALYWYFNISDLLYHLHNQYNCVGMMGETHTPVTADPMWWAIYARTLWDVNTDPRQVIPELCQGFYGAASGIMTNFYLSMDDAVRNSDVGGLPGYHPNNRLELGLTQLEEGRLLLEQAANIVVADPVLTRRIALARLAHAVATYIRTLHEPSQTSESEAVARQAFDEANALRSTHNFMVRRGTSELLASFQHPHIPEGTDTALDQENPGPGTGAIGLTAGIGMGQITGHDGVATNLARVEIELSSSTSSSLTLKVWSPACDNCWLGVGSPTLLGTKTIVPPNGGTAVFDFLPTPIDLAGVPALPGQHRLMLELVDPDGSTGVFLTGNVYPGHLYSPADQNVKVNNDFVFRTYGDVTPPWGIDTISITIVPGMRFSSVSGVVYRLEYTTNTAPPWDWVPAGVSIAGNGGDQVFFDPDGPDTNRTYRILEE